MHANACRCCSPSHICDSAANKLSALTREPTITYSTLSSNLGKSVPITTKVHFPIPMRADADRAEIQHGAVASEVTLAVMEVMG